jgi:hypothetical protein
MLTRRTVEPVPMYSQPPAQRTPHGLIPTEVARPGPPTPPATVEITPPGTEPAAGTPAPARAALVAPATPAAATLPPARRYTLTRQWHSSWPLRPIAELVHQEDAPG